MRRLLTLSLLGLFSAAVVGCEASAEVGDDDGDSYRRTTIDRDGDDYKKTTTIKESDGDTVRKTEIRED